MIVRALTHAYTPTEIRNALYWIYSFSKQQYRQLRCPKKLKLFLGTMPLPLLKGMYVYLEKVSKIQKAA